MNCSMKKKERKKKKGLPFVMVTRLLSQGYKVNRLSNTFEKFYDRHTDLVGQYKKNVCQMFADPTSSNDSLSLLRTCQGRIDKICQDGGLMQEADHAYSIRSTW